MLIRPRRTTAQQHFLSVEDSFSRSLIEEHYNRSDPGLGLDRTGSLNPEAKNQNPSNMIQDKAQ